MIGSRPIGLIVADLVDHIHEFFDLRMWFLWC